MSCVTIFLLAGSNYLEFSMPYGIIDPSLYFLFEEVITANDRALNNIHFLKLEADCQW